MTKKKIVFPLRVYVYYDTDTDDEPFIMVSEDMDGTCAPGNAMRVGIYDLVEVGEVEVDLTAEYTSEKG